MSTHRVREPVTAPQPVGPDQGAYGHDIPPELLRPRNGAGRAAAIFGILALICAIGFFLVLTVPLAVVLGLAAILFGVVGRRRFRRGVATNRGSATTGIVTGLLSLLILGGLTVGGVVLYNQHKQDFKDFYHCSRAAGINSSQLRSCERQFRTDFSR